MNKSNMSPVLKWAGGKKQLIKQIRERMPEQYNNYYEPFIGGAAVLLAVAPTKAYINDVNQQLINLYQQLKNDVETVIAKVNELDNMACGKELYYAIREQYNTKITQGELDATSAALLIWLNKHCFNGLYRVNRKGLFNVPYNNRINGSSIDEANVRTIASYLQKADIQISCTDFANACETVAAGDFVYFDSPYVPESTTADFTNYTMDGFGLEDHERLAELFKRLDKIGAKLMLSNNDVPMVRSLYNGYNIQSLAVKRMINRNANKRTGKEVIITNY